MKVPFRDKIEVDYVDEINIIRESCYMGKTFSSRMYTLLLGTSMVISNSLRKELGVIHREHIICFAQQFE
jgi:hypothetical protein